MFNVYGTDPCVTSWLKWLQIILNEFKWLQLFCKYIETYLESFQIIRRSWSNSLDRRHQWYSIVSPLLQTDHLESFKSWCDKISYTINMQCSLSFFVWTFWKKEKCWFSSKNGFNPLCLLCWLSIFITHIGLDSCIRSSFFSFLPSQAQKIDNKGCHGD